ncbi:hypothetical protein C4Z12_011580 [Klebsiella pneumoniae subsp. pneumoniae]|nr:hypothetical protein BME69_03785 [Klebsiella quasipneumoniae subsp. quasipneumoniae]ROD46233.1 hypothetical protein C4Z12_011580 [Klebsiella pneumoniae subsp. pneumoniae]
MLGKLKFNLMMEYNCYNELKKQMYSDKKKKIVVISEDSFLLRGTEHLLSIEGCEFITPDELNNNFINTSPHRVIVILSHKNTYIPLFYIFKTSLLFKDTKVDFLSLSKKSHVIENTIKVSGVHIQK